MSDERTTRTGDETMTKTTRNQLTRELETLQAALSGEEVNGVKLLPGNEEWAREHVRTLARLLSGATLADA
jgi:hypothetical protein